MDAHFNEYLAAVAGMADVYGDRSDEGTGCAAQGSTTGLPVDSASTIIDHLVEGGVA